MYIFAKIFSYFTNFIERCGKNAKIDINNLNLY